MNHDRFITVKPEGRNHRFYIDRGTHTLRSNKVYASRAIAMGIARRECKKMTFDLSLYGPKADAAALRSKGMPNHLN